MAQISKKPLSDPDSNSFLETKGLTNIINSFCGSAWRVPQLNLIVSLPIDTICRNEKDFIKMIYELGYRNGFDYANSISEFEKAIK